MADDRPNLDEARDRRDAGGSSEDATCGIDDGTATSMIPDPQPGNTPRLIGDFRIVRKIGSGGMGIVYEAEQQNPQRPVALKVIAGGQFVDELRIRLFQREAQALARLKHPSIAAIYESGHTPQGEHFFAMELIRGCTLGEYLNAREVRGGLTRSELRFRLRLFRRICDGVAYAHQRGVVHRDLKPTNIQIPRESSASSTPHGEPIPDAKILDFGLARITDADVAAATMVTEAGSIQGTLAYMSPEQVRGNPDEVDLRTDIYSLGVMLYEMVTGELPYQVTNKPLPEISRIICEQEPASVIRKWKGPHRPDRDLETIILKALEKPTSRRYQSVTALAEDIDRYLAQEPILARPSSSIYQLRKMVQRHRVAVGSGAIIALLVVAGVIALSIQARAIAMERDRANQQAQTALAATEFLVGLFEISDPEETRGETITAREVLDRGADRITDELKDEPGVRAMLSNVIGRVYLNLGLYDAAGSMFSEAFRLQSELSGELVSSTAESINNIGVVNLRKGNYEQAEEQLRTALAMRREICGESSSEVAEGLNNLGTLLAIRGKIDEAEPMLREALSVRRALIGGDDANTATMINNLAYFLEKDDRYDETDRLNREALAIRRQALGDNHPAVAQSLNNMGMVYFRRGDVERAEPLIREALDLNRRIFGERHPEVSASLSNLGQVLKQQGDFKQAEIVFREVLGMDRELLGDDHPTVGESACKLAEVVCGEGNFAEAEELFEHALAIDRATFGEDSWRAAITTSRLGECRIRQGLFSESEALLLSSHTVLSSAYDDHNPRTVAVTRRLVDLYEAWDRPDQAETWRRRLPMPPSG